MITFLFGGGVLCQSINLLIFAGFWSVRNQTGHDHLGTAFLFFFGCIWVAGLSLLQTLFVLFQFALYKRAPDDVRLWFRKWKIGLLAPTAVGFACALTALYVWAEVFMI